MVSPLRGGVPGVGSGWWGCEYLSGCMSEKYRASSSDVGACRSSFCAAVAFCAGVKAVSVRASSAIVVAARGVDS